MPLIQVKTTADLQAVIGNVSAVLHLDRDPNSLSAVQYCVSELVRNVLEHSESGEGAWVCAQRYLTEDSPSRVAIAVADCGHGIAATLSGAYPQIRDDDMMAIQLAMQPGVTGAQSGLYGGAPNNAGAGLFITRAIAKATGGYFVLISGKAAFRLNREKPKKQTRQPLTIFHDAFNEPNVKRCLQTAPWIGTVAA
ncbi:MAG: sensor histidine kinase, partial [Acidobacteriota bacterium]|nr:sensor histidine kinase [Acidobacteriota bacterium]